MATVQTIDGDITINGTVTANQINGAYNRSSMNSEASQKFQIPLTSLRVWDAFQTALGSASADDLGLATGTFGTGLPYIVTSDAKATTITQRARFLVQLPSTYVAGQAVTIRAAAGMKTTVSDNTATIDVEAFKSGGDTTVSGSDLVSTSATSINFLTFSNKDFSVGSAGLSPGDWLDVRVTISITDGSTGTSVLGAIAALDLLVTTRG